MVYLNVDLFYRAVDPGPHGSAFIFFLFDSDPYPHIRIQEGKMKGIFLPTYELLFFLTSKMFKGFFY